MLSVEFIGNNCRSVYVEFNILDSALGRFS